MKFAMGRTSSASFFLQVCLILLFLAKKKDSFAEGGGQGLNISAILDNLLDGYDKRIRPKYGGEPVEVGITMYILSISSLSEVQMDFTMDFYFRQIWNDHRLGLRKAGSTLSEFTVSADLAGKIWLPDTFFANEKSAYFHTATTYNSFLRLSAGGDILRSLRLTVTASCPMDLQYFPMDRQLCKIEIESFGYTMDDIKYKWAKEEKSIGIDPEVQLPQFKVVGHRQLNRTITLSTGNYSRLTCEIQFSRSMGYYMIQIYIPSSLIVIISWVSFWLNRNATPARVALGVTTVLTMTTLMSSTNAALPKISYVKSIDVYLGTCFVMVFASLLEYATVGYLGKRIQMRKTRLQNLQKLVDQRKQALGGGGSGGASATGLGGPGEPNHAESRYKMADPKDTIGKSHYHHHHHHHGPPLGGKATPLADSAMTPPGLIGGSTGGGVGGILGGFGPGPGVMSMGLHPLGGSGISGMGSMGGLGIGVAGIGGGTSIGHGMSGMGMASMGSMGARESLGLSTSDRIGMGPPLGMGIGGMSDDRMSARGASIYGTIRPRESGEGPGMSTAPPPAGGGGGAGAGGEGGGGGGGGGDNVIGNKNMNKLFGVSPSDIDKYSRVVFPVCFVCFNLMYWIIYLHISDVLETGLIHLQK